MYLIGLFNTSDVPTFYALAGMANKHKVMFRIYFMKLFLDLEIAQIILTSVLLAFLKRMTKNEGPTFYDLAGMVQELNM